MRCCIHPPRHDLESTLSAHIFWNAHRFFSCCVCGATCKQTQPTCMRWFCMHVVAPPRHSMFCLQSPCSERAATRHALAATRGPWMAHAFAWLQPLCHQLATLQHAAQERLRLAVRCYPCSWSARLLDGTRSQTTAWLQPTAPSSISTNTLRPSCAMPPLPSQLVHEKLFRRTQERLRVEDLGWQSHHHQNRHAVNRYATVRRVAGIMTEIEADDFMLEVRAVCLSGAMPGGGGVPGSANLVSQTWLTKRVLL